jgi:hypothetical protein
MNVTVKPMPVFPGSRSGRTRRDAGQVIVLFAGAMVMFIALLAVAVDLGYGFLQRRDAQNVSDLSALAGAQVIGQSELDRGKTGITALTDADVVAAVNRAAADTSSSSPGYPQCVAGVSTSEDSPCVYSASYVDKNRGPVSGYGAGGAIPEAARGVEVSTSKTWHTFFAGVVGHPTLDSGTSAMAMAVQTANFLTAGQLLPIGLRAGFQPGPDGVFYITEDTAGAPGPGNFGWLDWFDSNNSAADLGKSVCVADNPFHTLPYTVHGDTGKGNSSTVTGCIDSYITNGSVVLIPIYSVIGCDKQLNGNGECPGQHFEYTLTGYAAVRLIDYDKQAVTWLKAQIVYFVNPAGVLPSGSDVSDTPQVTPVLYGLVR